MVEENVCVLLLRPFLGSTLCILLLSIGPVSNLFGWGSCGFCTFSVHITVLLVNTNIYLVQVPKKKIYLVRPQVGFYVC